MHFFPERPDKPEYKSIDPIHHYDYNPDDGPSTRAEKADDMDFSHNYDGEPIHREVVPEHIHYQPMHPSEHHPLPVSYDIFPADNVDADELINPLHPLDPTRRRKPKPELDDIKPVKKYVDYYGAHYL